MKGFLYDDIAVCKSFFYISFSNMILSRNIGFFYWVNILHHMGVRAYLRVKKRGIFFYGFQRG